MDAVERGLAAVNEYVPEFMADHAGRLEIFTYGPAGGEPHVLSLDVGVHEIDGADATEWVAEGAMVVISLRRRRRVDLPVGARVVDALATDSLGMTAQVRPEEVEPATEPRPRGTTATPDGPFRSANGVVPHMCPASGLEEASGPEE